MLCLRNLQPEKRGQPALSQLSNPAKMNPASTVTELLVIILKMKPSKQVCFTNIKLLGSMFCLIHVKVLACVIRIILAIMFFFFKIAFALILSELKMYKTVQGVAKTRKRKDVTGEWKQGNFVWLMFWKLYEMIVTAA